MSKYFKIFSTSKLSFEGQLPDEKSLKVIRMHWFVLVKSLIPVFLFTFLLIIFSSGLSGVIEGELLTFFWFISITFFLYLWLFAFYIFTMYLLNVWIITDHRIIASEQRGLFIRSVAEINIGRIQDISVDVTGVFGTFLNFGDLEVQSAAAEKKFRLKNIENPGHVKDEITEAYNRFIKTHPRGVEPGGAV